MAQCSAPDRLTDRGQRRYLVEKPAGRARDFVETSSRYEGEGGYTGVNGERVPMYPGDLVLTPNCSWHDHHVVEGAGYSVVGGQRLDWEDKDVFTVWT